MTIRHDAIDNGAMCNQYYRQSRHEKSGLRLVRGCGLYASDRNRIFVNQSAFSIMFIHTTVIRTFQRTENVTRPAQMDIHQIVTLAPPPKGIGRGPSVLDGQDRTGAHYIKQLRYTSNTDTDQREKVNWPQPSQNSRFRESDETQNHRRDRQTDYIVPTNNTMQKITQRFPGVRESSKLVFVPVAPTPAARPIRYQYSPIRSRAFATLASGSDDLCSSL
jgi:hypothetical protein